MKKLLIQLLFAAELAGQTVSSMPPATGSGGTGAANVTASSVGAVTSLALDITTLNVTDVGQVITQCWSGASAPYSPVTITSRNPASLTSITVNFGSTANVTCSANATGNAGPTGAAGATGATGPAGSNGTNGAISQLQDEGTPLTVQPYINFIGAGITCVNDGGGTRTNCTVTGGGGGSTAVEVNGVAIGTEATINFIGGTGSTIAGADAGSVINVTVSADTATMLSRATDQAGTDKYCRSTTGNDTYTCNLTPALTAYTRGGCIVLDGDTANTGTASVNVNGLGARSILTRSGGALSNADITANKPITLCDDGTQYIVQGDGGGTTLAKLPLVFLSDQQLGAGSTSACGTFTGVTSASPPVVTCTGAHGLSTGDRVWITGVNGMGSSINDTNSTVSTVTNITSTTFSIQGKTGTGTWTSGGTASVPNKNWASGNSKMGFASSASGRLLPVGLDTLFSAISARVDSAAQPATGPLVCSLWVDGARSALQTIIPANESSASAIYSNTGSVTVTAGQQVAINCDNFATSNSTFPVITVQ